MRILLLLAVPLLAHDLYLRPATFHPAPGASLRVEYHNGDGFPSSEVTTPIERLRDMKVWSLKGDGAAFQNVRTEGKATVADVKVPDETGSALLVSRTVPNYIELDAAKFEEYLTHEGLDGIVAWRKKNGESAKPGKELYSKYAKALLAVGGKSSKSWSSIADLTIEIVPLANPYAVPIGGSLPIRVLYRGKPAAGLAIEASNAWQSKTEKAIVGRTDATGEITVPVKHPGLWKLQTILMERRTDRKQADWESYWASFTFELDGAAAVPAPSKP